MEETTNRYFKVWADWNKKIEPLDMEARGELFTALIDYLNGVENYSLSTNARFLFPTIKSIVDFDLEKAQTATKAHREAGKLGGRPKKNTPPDSEKPKGFSENQMKADKDKEKEQDKDNVSPPIEP